MINITGNNDSCGPQGGHQKTLATAFLDMLVHCLKVQITSEYHIKSDVAESFDCM